MIEVNAVNNIQNPYVSTNHKKEKTIINNTQPINKDISMKDLEALSVYNAVMIVNKIPSAKEPVSLIYNPKDGIESINGERILSSDGELVAIKSQDDKTETYYAIKDDAVKSVSVTDIKSGKELKYQNIIDVDGHSAIDVVENNPQDDTFHKATWYYNGIAHDVTANKDLPGDQYAGVSYDIARKTENYYISDPNGYIHINVNDKRQITDMRSEIRKNGMSIRKSTEMYNGAIISESVEKIHTTPNMAGLELTNAPELQPAEEYVVDENAKSNNGDKTYYSNGAIEKNKLPNGVTYYYSPKGDVQKITDGNKTITYEGKSQKIEEDLGNSETKTTTIYKNDYEVLWKDAHDYKQVSYLNNTVSRYEEGHLNYDGNGDLTKTLYFDKNGILESSYVW